MKIYRHRIKLDDATREELTEKYGNNFEGQYLLLYYPYLEVNIWDLPYFIEEFSADGFRLDLERDSFESVNIEPFEEKLIHWMLEEGAYGMGSDEIVTVEDAPKSDSVSIDEQIKFSTKTYSL